MYKYTGYNLRNAYILQAVDVYSTHKLNKSPARTYGVFRCRDMYLKRLLLL